MGLPGCHGPRSGSPGALGLPGSKRQREKGCRMVPRLPWRAVGICEAVFGTGAAIETGAQTEEAAAMDLTAAGVLE